MKAILSITVYFIISFFCVEIQAQQPIPASRVLSYAEKMPEFPKGQDSLMHFLATRIRYPMASQMNGEEGVSFISFVVDSTGNITDPTVVRSSFPNLDAEAIRVIGLMPKWNPGMHKGQAVNVKYTMPVRFQLASGTLKRIEVAPQFPTGVVEMMRFIDKNLKYPSEAKKQRIEGRSVISFTVNEDGSRENYKIEKALGYGTDEEAIRIIKEMPLWRPGTLNHEPKKVKFTLPIIFKL
jgi:TonB family protein